MDAVLNFYISMQISLSICFLAIAALHRGLKNMPFIALLRSAYILTICAFTVPVVMRLLPSESPFGQVIRVWKENKSAVTPMYSNQFYGISLPSTPYTRAYSWHIDSLFTYVAIGLIISFIVWKMGSLVKQIILLARLKNNAVLFRKIKGVSIWFSQEIPSPFSFYSGRAHILIPFNLIDNPENLKIAIIHELQHHRQHDTLWVYLTELGKILFGVNPVAQALFNITAELQELACDEYLIGQKRVSPHKYSKCLLEFAQNNTSRHTIPMSAVGMAADTNFLKRRIESMFIQKKLISKGKGLPILLAGMLALSSAAWASQGVVGSQPISLSEAQRLAQTTSQAQTIPVVVNEQVLHWLNKAVETESSRNYMRKALDRMKEFEPMITEKLEKANLPAELMAVPIIESGYKRKLTSPGFAAGIWQFIPQTARNHGLIVSSDKDERFNPEKLTDAAVSYYRSLNSLFRDWHSALVSYNIGEHRLASTIMKEGHNDVFRLAEEGKLGKEGGKYLPKVMAAMIILKNPELVN